MERQKKVVDASVILKWFIKEKDSEKALELREDYIFGRIILIVPELMFLEVINALRYKKLNPEKISYVNKSLWESEFHIHKSDQFIIEKAINIAIEYNITIYDALYVSIAQLHNAFLITADSKLYKIPNVIALEKI